MLAWATPPIALAAMLRDLDPLTPTWFRFLAASVILGVILGSRGLLRITAGRGLWQLCDRLLEWWRSRCRRQRGSAASLGLTESDRVTPWMGRSRDIGSSI
jgi:hypothetical protein